MFAGSENKKAWRLFWFYILLNMIPGLLLLFSEPLNIPGKIVLFLFPLGLYIVVFSLMKNAGVIQLILLPVLILHALQLVLFYMFGEEVVAADMFVTIVTTNSVEAGELLASIWPSLFLVAILYIPAIIIAIRQLKSKIKIDTLPRMRMIFIGIDVMLCSWIVSLFAENINTHQFAYNKHIYPVNVFYNLHFAVNKWQKSNHYCQTSADFCFNACKEHKSDKREIYVLVIGETSRAENWSLYGYPRETNPQLAQKDNLVIFKDAITQSNATHKSVSIMLSAADASDYDDIYYQKSLIVAFKEAGFKTLFLSNQGVNHTFTEYFSQTADKYYNVRTVNNKGKCINLYDDVLLSYLEEYIEESDEDLFVVFHTYGSHYNYAERYPSQFSIFKPDNPDKITLKEKEKLVNSYDNSILYTDHFLASLIDMLEKKDVCSALLYSSDHGEDILDDERRKFLHASPTPTFYQLRIPMFVWFSSCYLECFPGKLEACEKNSSKPVATNAIFHTLLDMAAINTYYLRPTLSLVNPTLHLGKRLYLGDRDEPIPFYQANLKKEDFDMIRKRSICCDDL